MYVQGGASGQTLYLVDFDLPTSAVCLILLGQLQIWQNWHSTWTTHQNSENLSQQNLGSDLMHHPVNVSLGEKVTYDVNEAKELIPRVLDNAELLEVNVDHTGVVLQVLNVIPVLDKSRLIFEEGLLQCAVKK